MFDIGWTELLLIGIVALIVVGPKDLPGMFHTLGRFTAKARGMAREFSRAMEDAANEAGVKDVSRTIKDATSLKSTGLDKLKDAATNFEKWDPMKSDGKNPAPTTAKMTEERAAAAEKMREKSAEVANKRIAETDDAKPEKKAAKPKAASTGKTTAKKTPAKTTAAKSTTAAKTATAKKPAAKKPAAKKTTAKKTSPKKAAS